MKLKNKFILSYFIVGLLPLLIFGAWSAFNYNKVILKNTSSFYKAQLFQINNNIITLISSVKYYIEKLSSASFIYPSSTALYTNFINADEKTFRYKITPEEQLIINEFRTYKMTHPYINSVYMGFEDGAFVRSEPRPRPSKYDPRKRPWYTLALENPGKVMQVPPYLSVTSDDVNIALVKTISRNGKISGVIGTDITLDRMSNFIHNIELLKGSYIMLTDANGIILTNPDKTKLFRPVSELGGNITQSLLINKEGVIRLVLNKIDSYLYYYTSPEFGWKICAIVPANTIREQHLGLLAVMIIAIIILAGLCAAVSFYLAKKLSSPFDRLIADMQKLTDKIKSQGYPQKISISEDDEIQKLADAFNEMSVSLASAYLELKSSLKRITELDKLKSAFVSMVSHELRTPLTIIKGSSSLLAKSIDSNLSEKQKALIEMILNSANKFQIIIDDLLDISKIESGVFTVKKIMCDISSAANHAADEISEQASKKNITIERIYADRIMWQADSLRLSRILFNLLNNAVKFSPENSSVKIKIEILAGNKISLPEYLESIISLRDNYLLISVTDSGPGVQDYYKDKIFDKFFQVEDTLTRQHQGAGIGLSIAKGLTEAHGGLIWVVSDGPDKGSTFCVVLPKK
ncbi:MAG: sensor histidine kinase [Candidatus Goldbacteria bacterium]|nr:sensor histidine kinase [Candidatus Goldiibacteriota bacterium]